MNIPDSFLCDCKLHSLKGEGKEGGQKRYIPARSRLYKEHRPSGDKTVDRNVLPNKSIGVMSQTQKWRI